MSPGDSSYKIIFFDDITGSSVWLQMSISFTVRHP